MAASSYMIAPGQTLEQVNNKRRLAAMLMKQGMDPKQIDHWTQGLGQMAQTGVGAYLGRQADQEDKEETARGNEMLMKYAAALQGGGVPAGANPVMAPPMGGSAGGPAPANTTGKIYSNDEPSPLDPPSGADRDRAIRTVVAEAGNQGPQGMNAVASVIRNRAVNGGYGGDTPSGVVTAPKQFEPWNDMSGRSRMAAIDPNSPGYQAAGTAIDQAYAGNDPTNGAMNFYAPKAQAALGRPAPAWDSGKGVDIGDHRFFGGAGGMSGAAPVQTTQADPARMQMLSDMLANRKTRPMAQQIIQSQVSAQMKPPEYKIEVTPDGRVISVNTKDPSKVQVGAVPGGDQAAVKHAADKEAATTAAKMTATRTTEEGMPASGEVSSKLRNEVQGLPSYKNLAQAAPVYKSMTDAAGRDNRAADVNLIYGMAKIMDPGSVVRESEMTVATAIATLPQQLQAALKSQMSETGRLTPELRGMIMQEARSRILAYQGMFDQDANMYRGIAQRGRMNEADVLPSFGPFEEFKLPAPAAAPPAAVQLTGGAAPRATGGTIEIDGYKIKAR